MVYASHVLVRLLSSMMTENVHAKKIIFYTWTKNAFHVIVQMVFYLKTEFVNVSIQKQCCSPRALIFVSHVHPTSAFRQRIINNSESARFKYILSLKCLLCFRLIICTKDSIINRCRRLYMPSKLSIERGYLRATISNRSLDHLPGCSKWFLCRNRNSNYGKIRNVRNCSSIRTYGHRSRWYRISTSTYCISQEGLKD